MFLDLMRLWKTNDTITSTLQVDGIFECYILEPNPPDVPLGIFDVTIRWSNKHQRNLPHIENVPGHVGIEIHIGNFRKDTKGCLLPGTERGDDDVLNSGVAFDALFTKIMAAQIRGEKIQIRVREGYAE